MKQATILIMTLALASAQAQPTLTANNNNPKVGDSHQQYQVNNPPSGTGAGPSGANVNWDYSALQGSNPSTINIQASNNPDFPMADILYTQAGASIYFGTSAGNFTFYGTTTGVADVEYSDGEDQVRFPITFGDSYTDTKAGVIKGSGPNIQVSGRIAVSADAYGSLTTPEATYSNALRLTIVRKDTSFVSGSQTGTSLDSIFYWYSPNIAFPVMTYQKNYVGGSLQNTAFTYLGSGSVGLKESGDFSFSLFPNPATDKVRFQGLPQDDCQLRLTSLDGQLLQSYQNQEVISVADLPAGMYLLEAISKRGKAVRRLVKE